MLTNALLCVQAQQATVQRADGDGPTELRMNLTTAAFNNVFVSSGEAVEILGEGTDGEGIPYCHIQYGKKKGWIKKAHVQAA